MTMYKRTAVEKKVARFTQSVAHLEAVRREPPTFTPTPVNGDDAYFVVDYAESLAAGRLAMAGLEEALPGGQAQRSIVGFRLLEDCVEELRLYLRAKELPV